MIDIHCHPLAGVDDGPEKFEDSVAMCRLAAADGITHLVATPHCNYSYIFKPGLNLEKIAELQVAVGENPRCHSSFATPSKPAAPRRACGPSTTDRESRCMKPRPI